MITTFESLRLGSWVNPSFPMQVTAIFDDEVWANFEGNEGDNWVFSEVEPIPLTEEWLVKLEFEKNMVSVIQSNYNKLIGRNRFVSVSDAGTANEIIFISEIEDRKVVGFVCLHNFDYDGKMYVHQLQNLLHSLTGQELTNKTTCNNCANCQCKP